MGAMAVTKKGRSAREQGFFMKASASLTGPARGIELPKGSTRRFDHESELAAIIGKTARNVKRENALDYVFGYSCLIDATMRIVKDVAEEERVMRKSFDTFTPLGPWIVTADEVGDPQGLSNQLFVNGECRQDANTRDMIVGVAELIELVSSVMTLYPGDVIATGTPEGMGPIKAGDKVTIRIERVGEMTVDVRETETVPPFLFEAAQAYSTHSSLQTIMANSTKPVLIVGGGPVGLALAGELGWRGVACTLIEKTDGAIEQPKMDLVGIRTMEFCRRWGILDWVRDAPYPLDYPQDYIYVTALNGYELGREPFPGRGFEPCPPREPAEARARAAGHVRSDPAALRRALAALVDAALQLRAVSISPNTPTACAPRCATPTTGETETIEADYMVGTDGGASTVREQLGIAHERHAGADLHHQRDVPLHGLAKLHDKGRATASSSSARRASGSPSSRSTARDRFRMSIVGTPQKINHTEDESAPRS